MENATQLIYSFPGKTRRETGASFRDDVLRPRETMKTQLLPSCTVEEPQETGAGQTLLLESEERRNSPKNQRMFEGLQVQEDNTDIASGDTQVLTDSDDDLLDHTGSRKAAKSFLYELWAQKKRSALDSSPKQPLNEKERLQSSGDKLRNDALTKNCEGSEQGLLEVDPTDRPGLALVVSSDASTQGNEIADGGGAPADSGASTTSSNYSPASHKGDSTEDNRTGGGKPLAEPDRRTASGAYNPSESPKGPTTNDLRETSIEKPHFYSEIKRSEDMKQSQNPEIDVLGVVNARTEVEHWHSNSEYSSGQGRNVRKLWLEDWENGVESLAQNRQESTGAENEKAHLNQKTLQGVLDPESRSKLNELSYADSYEPGEESQSNALAMVDKLVWFNSSDISEEREIRGGDKTEATSPRRNQLAKVGETNHSKKSMQVFDWVDSQFELGDEGAMDKCKHVNFGECSHLGVLGSKKAEMLVTSGKVGRQKLGGLKKHVGILKRRNSSWLGTPNIPVKKSQPKKSEEVNTFDIKALSDHEIDSGYGGAGISHQNFTSVFTNPSDSVKKSPQGGLAQVACTVMQKMHELRNGSTEPVKSKLDSFNGHIQMALEPSNDLPDNILKTNQVHANECLEIAHKDITSQSRNRASKGRKSERRVSWSVDTEIASKQCSNAETRSVPVKERKAQRGKARKMRKRNVAAKSKGLEHKINPEQSSGKITKSARVSPKRVRTSCTSMSKKMEEPSTSKTLANIGGVSTRSMKPTCSVRSSEVRGDFTAQNKTRKQSCSSSDLHRISDGSNSDVVAKRVKSVTRSSRSGTSQKQPKRNLNAVHSSGSVAGLARAVISAIEHSEEDATEKTPLNFPKVATRTQLAVSNLTKSTGSESGLEKNSAGAGQETEQQCTPSVTSKEVSPSESVKLRRRGGIDIPPAVSSGTRKRKCSGMPTLYGTRSALFDNKLKVSKTCGLPSSAVEPTAVEHIGRSGASHERVHFTRKWQAVDTPISGSRSNTAAKITGCIERKCRKRGPGSVNVLFSHGLLNETVKQQKKILKRLGGNFTTKATECTHFVTDKFVRTGNMLEVMAAGKPIVTASWLESSRLASYFVDEKNFILQDSKKEKELGFFMQSTLAATQQKPLLENWTVYVTPSTKPETVYEIIKAAGGKAQQQMTYGKPPLRNLIFIQKLKDRKI